MSLQSNFYSKEDVNIEKIKSKHIKDLTGKKFERWNVVGFAGLNKDLKSTWWCYCDCNKDKYYILVGSELTGKRTRSCGCLIKETNTGRSQLWKDAYKYNVKKKDIERLHRIFNGMKERCYNMLSKDFSTYGQCGIKICDKWILDINEFVDWALESGYSENLTIDRINVNGDYEPTNCRWITVAEQNRNKTTTVYVNYNGEKKSLMSVLKENGIKNNYSVYRNRICRYGWDIEKALSTPIRTHIKKESIDKLLNYFNNNENKKVDIKDFCKENDLNIHTFRSYLSDKEFMDILNKNNVYRKENGFLTYEKE